MPRAFVFDAYGTLFDVHAAIGRHRAAAGPDADRFSEIWRAKQLEYTWTLTLAGRYVDFWTLTERALDYAFARFPSVDKALKPKLLDAYLTLDAFPDARAVLRDLKARGRDHRDPLERLAPDARGGGRGRQDRRHLDAVLSVDAIRIYKPRPEVYALVTERFKLAPADVVFVSSNRWDVMGAAALRLSHRLDQSRQDAGGIRAGASGGARRSQRAHARNWHGESTSRSALTTASAASLLSRKTNQTFGRMKMRFALSLLARHGVGADRFHADRARPGRRRLRRELYRRRAGDTAARRPASLRQLATASRKDEGNTRFEVLQRTAPSNQFAIVAIWKDQKAYDAHAAAAHTKEFREKIKPHLISAIDDRMHTGMEIAGGRGEERARRDLRGDTCRRAAAEEGRLHRRAQDAGRGQPQGSAASVRFEVFQQGNRPNHFSVVEVWKSQSAYDAHITAAHTKKFRDQLTPMTGALYDERLYRAI